MKKVVSLAIFFSVCLNTILIKAQWNYSIKLDPSSPPSVPGNFRDVIFISETEGLYSVEYHPLYSTEFDIWVKATSDSGKTWTLSYSAGSDPSYSGTISIYTSIKQQTYYHAKVTNSVTSIDKTSDNGLTWNQIFTSGPIKDCSILDTSHFYVLTSYGWPYTTNYVNKHIHGVNHYKIDTLYNGNAKLLVFTDTMTGYIATSTLQNTSTHLILKSNSGGTGWFNIFSDSLMNINKMFFTTSNIGYAVGDSGKIIKTTDGGSNWQYLNTNTIQNLKSVFFLNDTIGSVAGDSGLIIKTIDGGATWHKQITGTFGDFSKIFFVNDSVGFALTGQDLYKTNQNPLSAIGETWHTNNFLIYPNPTDGAISIQSSQKISEIFVSNLLGEKIYSSQINSEKINIDLSTKPNGIYLLQVMAIEGVFVKKIILNR